MRRISTLATAGFLVLVPAFASAKPKTLENVSLAYTPTTLLGEKPAIDLTGLLRVKIELGAFNDTRTEPQRIGENREDADKGKILPVTTRDNVADWMKARIADDLDRYGFTVVEKGGEVILTADIRRFFVTEENTYEADVGILFSLHDASGKELWHGMANGAANRWGRSYKLENYQEAWSDGLFEALYSLVDNPQFRQALRDR